MRLHLQSIVLSAAALIGLAMAQSSQAADQLDATSAVRGSLGLSIEDLTLSSSSGAAVFLMNAGCAVLFAAFALIVTRTGTRRGGARMPFRPTSNFRPPSDRLTEI
jgi:hypothetical protein